MICSMPDFRGLHYLLEFAQIHVHFSQVFIPYSNNWKPGWQARREGKLKSCLHSTETMTRVKPISQVGGYLACDCLWGKIVCISVYQNCTFKLRNSSMILTLVLDMVQVIYIYIYLCRPCVFHNVKLAAVFRDRTSSRWCFLRNKWWQRSYPYLSYPYLSYPDLSYPYLSYPDLSYPYLSYPYLSLDAILGALRKSYWLLGEEQAPPCWLVSVASVSFPRNCFIPLQFMHHTAQTPGGETDMERKNHNKTGSKV